MAMARAAVATETVGAISRAIDTVSASTSVKPSTAAVVSSPACPQSVAHQIHGRDDHLEQQGHLQRRRQLQRIPARVTRARAAADLDDARLVPGRPCAPQADRDDHERDDRRADRGSGNSGSTSAGLSTLTATITRG